MLVYVACFLGFWWLVSPNYNNSNNVNNVNDANLNNGNNANNSNGVRPANSLKYYGLWTNMVIKKRLENKCYSLLVIRVSYTVNKITDKKLNIVRDNFSRKKL